MKKRCLGLLNPCAHFPVHTSLCAPQALGLLWVMEAELQRLEFVEGAPWGLSIVGLCPQMALPVTPALGESCCPFSSLERFPTRAQRLNHLFSTATPCPQVSCWWKLPALLRAAWAVWSSTSSPPHPCTGQPCGPSERCLLCLPARMARAVWGSWPCSIRSVPWTPPPACLASGADRSHLRACRSVLSHLWSVCGFARPQCVLGAARAPAC